MNPITKLRISVIDDIHRWRGYLRADFDHWEAVECQPSEIDALRILEECIGELRARLEAQDRARVPHDIV